MTEARIPRRRRGVALWALLLALGLLGPVHGDVHAGEWPADSYVLQVDGLACPYCGYGIEKQFQKRDGVEKTEIDIEKGVVVVHVKPGTRFSDDELRRIVQNAGFALGGITHRPVSGESSR